MSRMLRLLFVLTVSLVLYACAMYPAHNPVPPRSNPELAPNEGYLAIGFLGYRNLYQVQVRGPKSFSFENAFKWQRDQIKLFKLPAGNYQISGLLPNARFTALDIDDVPRWHFTVAPGKINYVGTLVIQGVGSPYFFLLNSAYFRNDLSLAIRQLHKQYPEIATKYEIQFANQFEDPFLNIVTKALKEAAQ